MFHQILTRGSLLGLLAVATFSCSEDKFKKYVVLEELRVLALVSDTSGGSGSGFAEVAPGTSTTITPWVSDITEATSLRYTWQGCADPGLNYGAEPSCENSATATSPISGTITTLNSTNNFSGAANSFIVTPPANLLDGRSAIEKFNGINYLVIYTVTNSAGASVKSFKRLIVSDSTKTPKNSNPQIQQILANGLALGTLSEGTTYTFEISFTSTSTETFQKLSTLGAAVTETEELQTTWFYSDGEVKYYRTIGTDSNLYKAPSSFPSSRKSFLIVVTHDSRGGAAVLKQVIHP